MMPGDPLSDTDAVVAWLRDEPTLWQRFAGRGKSVSVVTLGEIYYGAAKSLRAGDNRTRIDRLIATSQVIEITTAVAERYGALKQQLRATGKPIPDNDLWIAATAIHHALTLISRDTHFGHVEGLAVSDW